MEKFVDNSFSRAWILAALVLGVLQALFVGCASVGQATGRRLSSLPDLSSLPGAGEDPNVVAVIRTAEGRNVHQGDLCNYEQEIRRMVIYADGRVLEYPTSRSISCKGRHGPVDKYRSGRPLQSRIPGEKLQEVLTSLREAAQESEARVLTSQPRVLASGEDGFFDAARIETRAGDVLTHYVSWSLARDGLGTPEPNFLPMTLEPTSEGLDTGRRLLNEVRSVAVIK